MFRELVDELGKATRILVAQRQASRAMAIRRRDVHHAFFKHGFRQLTRLHLELFVLVRMRAVATAGDDERKGAWRVSYAEMQRGEPAHRIADYVRPLDAECIEYGKNVVPRTLLGIALHIRRHIRRRIASGVVGDAAIAAREMAQLRFPRAPVAGELMHEHDRRAGATFLVMQLYAVVGGQKRHGCALSMVLSGRRKSRPDISSGRGIRPLRSKLAKCNRYCTWLVWRRTGRDRSDRAMGNG